MLARRHHVESYQGWGEHVSSCDIQLVEVNIKLLVREQEDAGGNSPCLLPDLVHGVHHLVQLVQVLPSHHHHRLLRGVDHS